MKLLITSSNTPASVTSMDVKLKRPSQEMTQRAKENYEQTSSYAPMSVTRACYLMFLKVSFHFLSFSFSLYVLLHFLCFYNLLG